MNEQLVARIHSPTPKKILACDGGGILGLISVEVLARTEAVLREQQPMEKRRDFVLADYFDYFAGTSAGALPGWDHPDALASRQNVERMRATLEQMERASWAVCRFKLNGSLYQKITHVPHLPKPL